jgi:hypothetical protein
MVSIVSLWLPILLSAVAVFILSSIFHIVLRYHSSDFSEVTDEEKVMDDLRKYNIPPGEYSMPRAGDMKEMSSPDFIEKMKKGPVMMLTVMKNEPANLGPSLIKWFLYSIVVGIFAAYVAGRALGPEAHYLAVFRFTGVTAFLGYTLALWQETIWYNRKISTSIKNTFDGLIYALFTAGIFGWLWP